MVRASMALDGGVAVRLSVAGLDLSQRSSGVAIIDRDNQLVTYTFGSNLKDDASERAKAMRNLTIANDIIKVVRQHHVAVVAVEDYAFSRRSSSVHPLAELGGVVKSQLVLSCGIAVAPVTASSLRKFLFGKAISDKKAIKSKLEAMGYKDLKNCDESDALVVALVMDAYSNRRETFCQKHELEVFDRLDKRLACTG